MIETLCSFLYKSFENRKQGNNWDTVGLNHRYKQQIEYGKGVLVKEIN